MARKTFASNVLLYNDVPMEIVSELLGHSSMEITQEYYGIAVQKRVSEEMERISKIIAPVLIKFYHFLSSKAFCISEASMF